MSNNMYFSHDSNARNDSKMIRLRMKHGAAGYGVYFMVLERLREESGYMSVKDYNMIAFDLRVDASLVKSVVEDFGLFAFTDGGECFYSESFNRRMSMKDEVKAKHAEAGRKGMKKRWEDNKAITQLSGKDNKAITQLSGKDNKAITQLSGKDNKAITMLSGKDNKESKVKESKGKNISTTTTTRALDYARENPKSDVEELKRHVDDCLLPESEWREAVWMKHGIGDNAEYQRLLDTFTQECLCNGKTSHADDNDLRSHFNSWLRIQCSVGDTAADRRKGRTRTARLQTVNIPTEEEMAAEEAHKAEEERQRVLGIYEGARKGNRRFLSIVGEWAKNGTLREYGLEALT